MEAKAVEQKKRNIFIDLYKLVLALFVVFIHVGYFANSEFWLYAIRIAVPGFLIISGYFFYKDGINNDEEYSRRALKYLLVSIKYMLIGIISTMLLEIIIMGFILHYSIAAMFNSWWNADYFKSIFVTNYPVNNLYGFHLWYLIAVVISYLIIWILFKLKLGAVVKFLPLLFFVLLFFSIWLKYIPNQNGVVVSNFKTRNAYFMALPGIALGYDIAHFKKYKLHWAISLGIGLIGILFFVLQYFEGKAYGVNLELTVSSIISACCFIFALDKLPSYDCKIYNIIIGTNMSFFMYVYHVCVYKCINYFFGVTVEHNLAIITFFVTFACYLIVHYLYFGSKLGITKLIELIKNKK